MSVEGFVIQGREPELGTDGVIWGNLPDEAEERAKERAGVGLEGDAADKKKEERMTVRFLALQLSKRILS